MTERHPWWLSSLLPALLVALGYYLGAKVGFALTLQPTPVSTLWPPNAILLAGLLLTPLRSWGLVLLSVFAAHVVVQVQSGVPAAMLLSWFVSNCTEALIGASAVRWFAGERPRFDRFPVVVVFLVGAGFLAPFASSFLDAAFVVLNQWGDAAYWSVWQTRFFSNVLAELTLVPVIVTFVAALPRVRRVPRRCWFEAAAGAVGLLAICWVVFVLQKPGPGTSPGAAVCAAPAARLGGREIWSAGRQHVGAGLRSGRDLGRDPRPGALRPPITAGECPRDSTVSDRDVDSDHVARRGHPRAGRRPSSTPAGAKSNSGSPSTPRGSVAGTGTLRRIG